MCPKTPPAERARCAVWPHVSEDIPGRAGEVCRVAACVRRRPRQSGRGAAGGCMCPKTPPSRLGPARSPRRSRRHHDVRAAGRPLGPLSTVFDPWLPPELKQKPTPGADGPFASDEGVENCSPKRGWRPCTRPGPTSLSCSPMSPAGRLHLVNGSTSRVPLGPPRASSRCARGGDLPIRADRRVRRCDAPDRGCALHAGRRPSQAVDAAS